jgi:cytochrome c55X
MGIGPIRPVQLRVASLLVVLGIFFHPFAESKGAQGDIVPAAERRADILNMVRQDCGSCHGMTLKGGLGPPLTPGAVQSRPSASLVATILHGRPGTAMPPWQDFLSVDEAIWIVEQLQQGLPDAP